MASLPDLPAPSSMRFIHAADLHLDSPLRGLDPYAGAPVERLRGATRQAFLKMVGAALEHQVDLVILAGDIFDGDWTDFHTGLFFREQLVRLTRGGIRVFIAKGNHDAESQISRQLPSVDGVHVFRSRAAETVVLDELGVAVHGRSFPQRAVSEDLVPDYPMAIPGLFNIGVLHTSLTGNPDHDTYAPTSVAVLASRGYDYFALGHVHARQIVQADAPRIVFPGNLQGRHARETGPKGCELVEVDHGRIASSRQLMLDVVRWHQLVLNVEAHASLDSLAGDCRELLRAACAEAPDRLHAVRMTLTGRTVLHALEAREPGTLRAAVQAAAQDLDIAEVWIEQVILALRSPRDRATLARRDDAFGEVVKLADELMADDSALLAFARENLAEMARMPAELADASPARLNPDELRQALEDALASVLAPVDDEPGQSAP